MQRLHGQKAVVIGGNRGLGLAMVESLVARGVRVTVVGRDEQRLNEVASRLGVDVVRGDATDEALAKSVLADVRPTLLVVNAAALPELGSIHEQSWEGFSRTWNTDVRAILVFRERTDSRPGYFAELELSEGRVMAIKDFRYVPYILTEASRVEWVEAGDAAIL
jgi:NAD(P)-dependent dehydrogenase (short-subunit alcohol dehydrogenase family)